MAAKNLLVIEEFVELSVQYASRSRSVKGSRCIRLRFVLNFTLQSWPSCSPIVLSLQRLILIVPFAVPTFRARLILGSIDGAQVFAVDNIRRFLLLR